MAQKIVSLKIQEFLNDIKKNKNEYISKGVIVFPDVFSGEFQNNLFEHKQYKKLISDKLKEIFATDWVVVDVGIIKKERIEDFYNKNNIKLFDGYEKSPFIPIARLYKNSNTNEQKEAVVENKELLFDIDYFNATMQTLFYKIVEEINKSIDEKNKANDKFTLPGVSADVVFDLKKYREFKNSLTPFIEKLEIALGFTTRKDIIGNISYYIKRDVGGILKIDALKNHSHDTFNHIYKEKLASLQKDENFEKEHEKIKIEIKKTRDLFLQKQKEFFRKIESRVLEDDFFSGRSNPDKKREKFAVDDDMQSIFSQFPSLEKDFFESFLQKIEMVLHSNNVTKKDAAIEYRFVNKKDEPSFVEMEFKNIENFRITRGLTKYNGINTNIPLDEEEQELLEKANEMKNKLLESIDGFYEKRDLNKLYEIKEELEKIKKRFPLILIDLKDLEQKIKVIEDAIKKEAFEKKEYENALLNINKILSDPKRLEDEIFNLSLKPDEVPLKGLKSSDKQMNISKITFIENLASVIVNLDGLSLRSVSNYDSFELANSINAVFNKLYNTFIQSALLDLPDSKKEQFKEEMMKNTLLKDKFLTLSNDYFNDNKSIFINAFSNSFFDMAQEANSPKQIPKIIDQMIEGTHKYKPIFETQTGHVTHRSDQMYMRVKEAGKLKNTRLSGWSEKMDALELKLIKIHSDDKAYNASMSMDSSKIQTFTPNFVTDVVFNKDGRLSDEKRMFLWLRLEHINIIYAALIEARRTKKLEHRRAALDSAIKFFESLKRTNTKEQLDAKIISHKAQLEREEQNIAAVKQNYEKENKKQLYEFDGDLKRMKEAFVKNFCAPRK